MANGLPRTQKYRALNVEEHLMFLDNDLDASDYRVENMTTSINKKLNYLLVTFISLLVMVSGASIVMVTTHIVG